MEGFIGEIRMFGGNFAPRSWAFCEGQLLPISQNSALFSILGTTYGGDGRTTFGLPDLRGRVPVGQGNGPGLPGVRLGQMGNLERVTLTQMHLPSHDHEVSLSFNPSPDSSSPENAYFSGAVAPDVGGVSNQALSFNNQTDTHFNSMAFVCSNNGGNQAIDNRQPYISIYYIIAMFGTYPSRS